ncbi:MULTISPECIES: TolC family protein [Flavobacterium]|nr:MULTISPECIES: TolC family protein [Flavobacterium]OXA75480.1 ABC transporter permease [Flavobacterium columnare] [Flavobacterium columnare NBRC 100251 = ATCC 23463]AMA50591.1 ABC transporter permease [Flavobacterium covae]AND65508.1 ABC transporter permease [Flavobacterium covae]MCJ1806152.1 TolC family protein [Flavobacterium covae]MCJ1808293.1 TolC family protein [Flavobacterium covae]
MKHQKKIISALLLVIPLMLSAQTAPSLETLINEALKRDASIKNQLLESKTITLNQQKLKDLFLPKVDISGKAGYLDITSISHSKAIEIAPINPIFPGITVPEGALDNNFNLSGIEGAAKIDAKVLVYSGGKIKHLKQALEEKNKATLVLNEKNKDEIVTQIIQSYDQFALLIESKKVLNEGLKRLAANKKLAEKALGYGLITRYDYQKIDLAEATLNSKIVEYEGKKELLTTQLHILTGIETEKIALIEPSLQKINHTISDNSINNRAELKALDHGMKALDYKIKADKTWWIPKVQAGTSLSYLGFYNGHLSSSKNLIPNIPNSKLNSDLTNKHLFPIFRIDLGFKWEIFDGNESSHEIEKTKIEKEILENKKSDAERKLSLNLANNQTLYNIANAQINLKAKAKEIAQNAFDQAEKEFKYGLIKSNQLIEAENDLQMAELEYQTSIFNQRRAAIELMKSTQSLDIQKL